MAGNEVRAVLKYVRISPQKVRRILDLVKGLSVEEGLNLLKYMPQKAAGILSKVIRSAAANAEQKYNLDVDDLIINNAVADQGPMLKRFKARARGRGTRILKRTAHITVTVCEKPV